MGSTASEVIRYRIVQERKPAKPRTKLHEADGPNLAGRPKEQSPRSTDTGSVGSASSRGKRCHCIWLHFPHTDAAADHCNRKNGNGQHTHITKYCVAASVSDGSMRKKIHISDKICQRRCQITVKPCPGIGFSLFHFCAVISDKSPQSYLYRLDSHPHQQSGKHRDHDQACSVGLPCCR